MHPTSRGLVSCYGRHRLAGVIHNGLTAANRTFGAKRMVRLQPVSIFVEQERQTTKAPIEAGALPQKCRCFTSAMS
jgi:hypothetical protein